MTWERRLKTKISYFKNRKISSSEQFQHWKNNWRNGILRLTERLLTKRNISDLLGGNLLQVFHLPEVKNQLKSITRVSDGAALPAFVAPQVNGNESIVLNEVILPQYSLELKNLTVDARSGLAQLDAGFLIDSTLAHWQRLLYRGGMAHSVARLSETLEFKTGTWIVLPFSPYYFHTLIEDIPLILEARRVNPKVRVMTSSKNPVWTFELLEIMGVEYVASETNAFKFENYVAITSPRAISPLAVQIIHSAIGIKHKRGNQKIFISRGSGLDRSDINLEKSIMNYLEPVGFQAVDPSKLSVAEQILIFSEAKIIVGLHGGALANMIWCKPGAQVIEIFNHPYRTHDFIRLSAACKHQYSWVEQNTDISNEEVAKMIFNQVSPTDI